MLPNGHISIPHKGAMIELQKCGFKTTTIAVIVMARFRKNAPKVWKGITPEYLKSLYESMPRQMQVVIAADRGHTK